MAEEERNWKSPFRFLGIGLANCGLENANMSLVDFKTRLYLTGLPEDFIDTIKLRANAEPQGVITRMVLRRITYYFTKGLLQDQWFRVFRDNLWPPETRTKLCKGKTRALRRLAGRAASNVFLSGNLRNEETIVCDINILFTIAYIPIIPYTIGLQLYLLKRSIDKVIESGFQTIKVSGDVEK